MPNTKDLLPNTITTLIVGPGKTGKTRALRTWRKVSPKVHVFNFDGGIAALAGEDIEYDVFQDTDRYKPTAYTSFLKRWDEIVKDVKPGDVLALDGLTFMSRALMNYVQFMNRTIDKAPGYEGYRSIKEKMRDVVVKARTAGCHLVATVNDTLDQDEQTQEISRNPDIDGSYRFELATEFDLVVWSKVGRDPKDPKKPRYYWQTVPDHQIRSAGFRWECGLLPEEEPDFEGVLRKIREKYPHVATVGK